MSLFFVLVVMNDFFHGRLFKFYDPTQIKDKVFKNGPIKICGRQIL